MALDNAKRFMEELNNNEKALEILKAKDLPDDEQRIVLLASAARETGYDVSDEEMKELFAASKKVVVQSSDQAAAAVQKLSREEIDTVAGGNKHPGICIDTFKEGENCWFNDSCDYMINEYRKKYSDGTEACFDVPINCKFFLQQG